MHLEILHDMIAGQPARTRRPSAKAAAAAAASAKPKAMKVTVVGAKAPVTFTATVSPAAAAPADPATRSPRKAKVSMRQSTDTNGVLELQVSELPITLPPLSEADLMAQKERRAKKKRVGKDRVAEAAEEVNEWPFPPTKEKAISMIMQGATGASKSSIMSLVMGKHEVSKKRYEVKSSRPDGFKLKCPFGESEGCSFVCVGGYSSYGAGKSIFLLTFLKYLRSFRIKYIFLHVDRSLHVRFRFMLVDEKFSINQWEDHSCTTDIGLQTIKPGADPTKPIKYQRFPPTAYSAAALAPVLKKSAHTKPSMSTATSMLEVYLATKPEPAFVHSVLKKAKDKKKEFSEQERVTHMGDYCELTHQKYKKNFWTHQKYN